MGWGLDFRDHGDETLGGVSDDFADVLPGIKAPDPHPFPEVGPGTDARQLGILPDLHPPAIHIGEMKMEAVELVIRHPIEAPENTLLTNKLPRRIEQHTAPGKAGLVLDAQHGHRPLHAGLED